MGTTDSNKKMYIGLLIVAALASTQFRTLTHFSYNLEAERNSHTAYDDMVHSNSSPMRYWEYQNISEICPEEETIIFIITKVVNGCFKYPHRLFFENLYPDGNIPTLQYISPFLFIIIISLINKVSALAIPLGGHAPPLIFRQ